MVNKSSITKQEKYWDKVADAYCSETTISLADFHYGPLLPGNAELCLLPELNGLNCLEVGCGAAQNSIFLATQGAYCTAIDISSELLKTATELAAKNRVKIELHQMPMDEIVNLKPRKFELIHSSYALPFAVDPGGVISQAAQLLIPGGQLIFSTVHPLFAGEWLELDGSDGLFLQNYFTPPVDCRFDDAGNEEVRSNAYPIAQMCDWILDAGLTIERILEPQPANNPPYYSNAWNELRPQMEKIPASIIFSARKILFSSKL